MLVILHCPTPLYELWFCTVYINCVDDWRCSLVIKPSTSSHHHGVCRSALGDRPIDLMKGIVETLYSNPLRAAAPELNGTRKQRDLLRCIEFAPTLSPLPATALHIGFNGAVPPHHDPCDAKWSLLMWYQVGCSRIVA